MIKLSDYVFKFLAAWGVRHVFVLPGGGCIHLCDSLGKNPDLDYIPLLHEQAISIAVEAYGQHTNRSGVALVTAGPGATNSITGVTAGWIDSTPMLIISGQAKTADLIGDSGVRQIGSQEVQIIPMVRHITKYAATVLNPLEIKYHLEKALYLANSGRKGPSWIEIPLDVQGAMIDEESLKSSAPESGIQREQSDISALVDAAIQMLNDSQKPLFLVGNGVKLSGTDEKFLNIARTLNVPIQTTWKIIDMLDNSDELNFGCPGLLGHRSANFILQDADLLIVLGSRLDFSLTAYNNGNFGKSAKKILVDIDVHEIGKLKDMDISLKIVADMTDFLGTLESKLREIKRADRSLWLRYCKETKAKYPAVTEEHYRDEGFVNTYAFIDKLSDLLEADDIIVPESSGNAGEVTYQAIRIKRGQKMKNAAGLGSMGFGLPYAIGSCIANDCRRTVLINGDGAFQLNIQELAPLVAMRLPIKIFIWDNDAYATIMATQRNMFDGNYVASERHSKLRLPDTLNVARAYGLRTFEIRKNSEIEDVVTEVLNADGPVICNVKVSPLQTVSPRVQSKRLPDGGMVSMPLENMWPYLEEEINKPAH
ncbi:MAG: thiamine pyrophosphate-binding protein [Synergistaceae bacterium]|jgi:acetolactate synthase-1/2/3 large subunit|nr:thiamine pyrophosphate-binding protein [Synergistaceae bacterium]